MSSVSRVFVIGAPSGTGKTTLLQRLVTEVGGLRFAVSHTTRARRAGEVEGRAYHFVERSEFERMAAAGEFLEWALVYGNLYGTHRSEVERAARDGVDLVLDIDVQGARSVRRAIPGAVMILILPPSMAALEARLRTRGTDSEATIEQRLGEARAQLEGQAVYDYAVVNDDLGQAFAALGAIVTAERHRRPAQATAIQALLGPAHGPA